MASVVRTLLRPASLLAPLYGSDRIAPAIGDFYVQAFNGSVTLPVAGYNYSSGWTPLLAGLSPAGMAASLAAPDLSSDPWTPTTVADRVRLPVASPVTSAFPKTSLGRLNHNTPLNDFRADDTYAAAVIR